MAPLPKRRWSTRRQGKKRATHKQKAPQYQLCSHCQEPIPPHTACPACGYYKGKPVLKIRQKKEKKNENRQ